MPRRLIHLVRDARGVAWSMGKSAPRDVAHGIHADVVGDSIRRASALWSLTNVLCELCRAAVPAGRSLRVRYEDFAERPSETLDAIGRFVDLDYREVAEALRLGSAGDSARWSPR